MANTFRVTTLGLKEFKTNIDGLKKEMRRKTMRSATTAGARVIVLEARRGAPVKTGALKKSIESLRDIRESKIDLEVRAVSVFKVPGVYAATRENVRKGKAGKTYLMDPPTFYWKFNELGTVKQPAKPFIEPALANNIQKVTDAVAKKLAEGIAKTKMVKP
jgi:HK97 gp10 family phage protein